MHSSNVRALFVIKKRRQEVFPVNPKDYIQHRAPGGAQAIARLAYEFGTLRRLQRMHEQTLLTSDPRDTIAAHTSRVVFLTLVIAEVEKLDIGKALSMAVLHDLPETRTGDHNWVAKKYVVIDEERIIKDQVGLVPFLKEIMEQYNHVDKSGARDIPEAKAVKDADQIEQLLLLCEHEHSGNQEAAHWLSKYYSQPVFLPKLHYEASRWIATGIFETSPTEWWKNHWTNKNRSVNDAPKEATRESIPEAQ